MRGHVNPLLNVVMNYKVNTKLTLDECDDEVKHLWVDEGEEDVGELEEVAREESHGEALEQRRGDPRRRLILLHHMHLNLNYDA